MDVLSSENRDALVATLPGRELAGMSEKERLDTMFRVWCSNIGYSTIPKILAHRKNPDAALWGMDTDELVSDALAGGFGGSCFPLASGFAAAVRSVDLDARVHAVTSVDRVGEEPEHAVVIVTASRREWLCDPSFLHTNPAPLENRAGRHARFGPEHSPLWLTNTDGDVTFEVERGTSHDTVSYMLAGELDRDGMIAAYETAGREPRGMWPYLRLVRAGRQHVISQGKLTTKEGSRCDTHTLNDTELRALLRRWRIRADQPGVDELLAQPDNA